MRYSASEKLEIIRLVEQSHLPVRRTLAQIEIPRSTFYRWCDQYQTGGPEALDDRSPRPDREWNRIPDDIRARVVTLRSIGCALHRCRALLRVGSLGFSPAQGPRPDHQPGLHHDEGGRQVQEQDDCAEPALADRLHLKASGATSLRAIAKALNARGIPTARGGIWTPVQVAAGVAACPARAAGRRHHRRRHLSWLSDEPHGQVVNTSA